MARIAIVDDHPFFRMGLEAALGEAGHQVVLSTGDSLTAEGQLAASDAQVVLLDQRMAPKTGADILSAIRLAGDTRPVVVLTNELGDRALLEVMRAKVNGIVFKHGQQAELFEAIDAVLAGKRYLDGALIDKAMALSTENGGQNRFDVLTERELAVSRLVAKGLRNREIGAELGMTEGTVKVYLHNIYRKLDLPNRASLALAIGTQQPA